MRLAALQMRAVAGEAMRAPLARDKLVIARIAGH